MAIQGSDAALNLLDYVTIASGDSKVVGLLHVYGMTRLTYHVIQSPVAGVLPAQCEPLVGYRRNPAFPGDIAFTQPTPGLLPVAPPGLTAGGLALFTVNTVATETMGIRITNLDPGVSINLTVILSASA